MQFTITDGQSRADALLAVSSAPLGASVVVNEKGEKRRDRQNRFSHEVYRQVAKMLGDRSQTDVRAESKLHIGTPILRAHDPDFRAKYDEHIKPLPYETKLAVMVEPFDFPVTSLMTVKVMAEYITALLQYWDERNAPAMLDRYDL